MAPAGRSRMPSARAELPVRLGREVELRRLAPGAHHAVGGWRRLREATSSGKLGTVSARWSSAASTSRSSRVERLHLFARGLEPRHQLVGGLAGALAPRHFLTGRVALGLERLDAHQDLPPPAVELEQLVQHAGQRRVAAPQQAGAAPLGILAQTLEVDHWRSAVGNAGREVLVAAVHVGQGLEVTSRSSNPMISILAYSGTPRVPHTTRERTM